MDKKVLKFTSSLNVDKVLAKYDCIATSAHVEMLAKCGYLSASEKRDLLKALGQLLGYIQEGTWKPTAHEDVHSAVQDFVESKAPKAAKKMHTGRSRNEQVVNDVRLYTRDAIKQVVLAAEKLQAELVKLADGNKEAIIPGYTHINRAQPVLFAHLMLSYVEMLERDKGRLADALKRSDICVMGSGALAGSALELDRKFTAKKLGFSAISANSLDSVSDRDFMAEAVSALAITAVHLSRMSEDLILYSIPEFGYIDMGMEYCTGSSLMPQKKNPDVLELIRGRSAGVISSLNSLLILLKGLPHTYNRDLQEDKKPFFESFETVSAALELMAGLVSTIEVKAENALEALQDEFIYATDIAEHLVGKGVAFRDAHDIAGRIVKECSERGINISGLSIAELGAFSEELGEGVYGLLSPETSVKGKKTEGSTNPARVAKEIAAWKRKLGE
jgi:argininosuccinate lyase